MIPMEYDMVIFKEDHTFVAHCSELDVASCGQTVEEARANLKTAVRLFVEEAEKMGSLEQILEEARYEKGADGRWHPPRVIATELVSVA